MEENKFYQRFQNMTATQCLEYCYHDEKKCNMITVALTYGTCYLFDLQMSRIIRNEYYVSYVRNVSKQILNNVFNILFQINFALISITVAKG